MKRKSNKQMCILLDVCQRVGNSDIEIIETTTNTPSGVPKAIFKAKLQTLEEKNQNGRFYTKAIGREIVETLRPKAKGRSLFQEIDHPLPIGDQNSSRRRAVTVEMKNCGSLLRDIYIENNDIIGEVETLSGFLGPDVYNLIVHDKADIGYSLRMFGRVETEGATGISKIVRPIRPITYDTVTNPSHSTARIMEFLPEDINSFIDQELDMELLNESIFSIDNLDMQNINESVYEYVDRIVQDFFENMGPVEFKL